MDIINTYKNYRNGEELGSSLTDSLKLKLFKSQPEYVNKTKIDEYIDRFWFLNCPSSISTFGINDQVYALIHNIIVEG